MTSSLNYWFTDFAIAILTLNSFVVKRLINLNIEANKVESVLDIGCGTGTQAPLFSKTKYLGFDVDKNVITYAKRIHPGYKFIIANATNFDLKKKFGLLVVVGVLHHMSDTEMATSLKNMKKHLKTTGKILFIEAIPPLFRWNIVGMILRYFDKGSYIRKTKNYARFIEKEFAIISQKNIYAGLFDYAFIIACQKGPNH